MATSLASKGGIERSAPTPDDRVNTMLYGAPPASFPVISANIYCYGFIDELLRQVVLPFWKSTRVELPESRLWLIRYDRGGQHLKIRFHAPVEWHGNVVTHLRKAVESFFSELPSPAGNERDAAAHLPPIDPEDYVDGLRPDRNLVWTSYRYSPELVGAEALSSADGFEAAFVRCRVASTEVTLEWLDALESGEIPMKRRMSLALQIVLAAVHGVHPATDMRARYLTFQRDWLLRVNRDRELALALLERKVDEILEQQTVLGSLITATCFREGALGHFCQAVAALTCFCLNRLDGRDLSALDGPSEVLIYSALSRVIHNAMNLAAIGTSNEAYICHLLRSVLARAQMVAEWRGR
jgi:hypothetical protein